MTDHTGDSDEVKLTNLIKKQDLDKALNAGTFTGFASERKAAYEIENISMQRLMEVVKTINAISKPDIKYGKAWPDGTVTFYNNDNLPVIFSNVKEIKLEFSAQIELPYHSTVYFSGIPIYDWPKEDK